MTQSVRPVGPGAHVFLVDGSSFVFRAYFQSIRQDQKYNYRSDRLPVGAVRLFATKVLQFLREGAAGITPTHLAIIFDKSENSFRRELYPPYKAHRPDPPADLVPQFPLMRDTVRAFGLTPIEQDRYEADDLIATYATQARALGADVLIVSADKDLMQLVGPGVAMFDPASGDREERRIGPAEVVEYFGLGADKVVDIQALAGDSTDNVPGAPGIGVKTAAQLIGEYGDLDTLLARAGEIKQPKRRETLTDPESVKLIRLSRQLVNWCATSRSRRRSTRLACPSSKARRWSPSSRRWSSPPSPSASPISAASTPTRSSPIRASSAPAAGAAATAKPAAPTPAADTPAATQAPAATAAAASAPAGADAGGPTPQTLAATRVAEARALPFDVAAYQTVSRRRDAASWIDRARDAGVVAFDTETSSLDPLQAELVGASLAVAPGEACYIPIGHRAGEGDLFDGGGLLPGQIAEADAIALLKPLLEDPGVLKIGQNVKFDWHVFKRRGDRGRALSTTRC